MFGVIMYISVPYINDITSRKMVEVTPGSVTAEKSQGWLEIGCFSDQIDRADVRTKICKKLNERVSEQTNEINETNKIFRKIL